jgi:hypothetical protein
MKNKFKLIILLITGVICFYIISFNLNLLLNKKYAVDEISFTNRKKGLIGLQEIISNDYANMFYLNIFYIILLIGLVVIILIKKKG